MIYKKRPYGLKSIGRFHINNLIFKNNFLPPFHIIKKAETIFIISAYSCSFQFYISKYQHTERLKL